MYRMESVRCFGPRSRGRVPDRERFPYFTYLFMDPLGPDPLIRSFERHLYAENRSAWLRQMGILDRRRRLVIGSREQATQACDDVAWSRSSEPWRLASLRRVAGQRW